MITNPYYYYDFAHEIPDPEDLSDELAIEPTEDKPTS